MDVVTFQAAKLKTTFCILIKFKLGSNLMLMVYLQKPMQSSPFSIHKHLTCHRNWNLKTGIPFYSKYHHQIIYNMRMKKHIKKFHISQCTTIYQITALPSNLFTGSTRRAERKIWLVNKLK